MEIPKIPVDETDIQPATDGTSVKALEVAIGRQVRTFRKGS